MTAPLPAPLLLGLMATLATDLAGCGAPAVAEACFIDAHCPSDSVCAGGQCIAEEDLADSGGSADTDEPAEKLDVASGLGGAATCEAASFVATNAGCEFWAVDLPNAWHPSDPYSLDVAAEQTFAVVVANTSETENATVAVYIANGREPIEEATVGPLGTYAFLLPDDLQIDPERNGLGRAFRVDSDLPITAYQFQPLDNIRPVYSNDASSLLPAHVLQNDYIAITELGRETTMYPSGWEPVSFPTGAFVTVVATEDDTHVEFTPRTTLVGGAWQNVTIDRGESFTILSDPSASADDASLSGARVISSKPIAAFSGNTEASVPRDATQCCRDHVEHQLLPTVAWGARYVTAPPPDPSDPLRSDPVVVRLVGAYDDTRLRYPAGQPSGAPDIIHAHESLEFNTTDPVIIDGEDPSKPFAVAQFLYNSGEANPDTGRGDPSMIVVPAVEQMMDRYVFLAPVGYEMSAVTIVAPEGADVTLDGRPVAASATIGEVGDTRWGYRRAQIDPGAHVVSADAAVGITVVGYDQQVSYAYAGGSAVNAISDAPPAP